MPTVAVIGASRGIGLGLVERYAEEAWRVHATTRTPREPGRLGEVAGDVRIHGLEVTDRAQREAFRDALGNEVVDVLIHNAGVYGNGMTVAEVNRVNVEAPIETAELLMDVVARSRQRTIALMSSQKGARRGSRRSLGKYGDSKAALNDRFRALADGWRRRGCLAVVIHPGWVRTELGGPGAEISVEESVCGVYEVLAGLEASHHGRFWTWDGREHPW